MKSKVGEICLKGIPISQGVAIGQPYFIDVTDDPVPEFNIDTQALEAEIERYRAAISAGQEEVQALQLELVGEGSAESREILETHLHMMCDPEIMAEVQSGIRKMQKNAEYVFQAVMWRYQKKFNSINDAYFLDRLKDIRDVSRRILSLLRRNHHSNFQEVPPGSIIFMRELSPTDVVEADSKAVAAFVTQGGGVASHAAIISKARGIPFLTNVDFNQFELPIGDLAIVDASSGELFINPDPETLEEYHQRHASIKELKQSPFALIGLDAKTSDGHQVRLSANISMVDEIAQLQEHSDLSVGLFRSEYVFLSNEGFPCEETQFKIYRQIVAAMNNAPIVIRVFDLGGDKYMFGQKAPYESNPFLGCRAIRFLLRERQLFKTQLKAILRASVFGQVSIMFPMVSSLGELIEAKNLLREAQLELQLYDQIKVEPLRVGCMIEVPAAAIIADLLAQESDFLSIGTNDLVQYALAVDRGNHSLGSLYTFAHPAIIRLIKHVVVAADQAGIPVSICGEVAADPFFTPLLLGLGIDELSVALCHLKEVETAIRHCDSIEAAELAKAALAAKSSQEIEALLKR